MNVLFNEYFLNIIKHEKPEIIELSMRVIFL